MSADAYTDYLYKWEDLPPTANHFTSVNPLALTRLLAEIRETARAREDMMRAEQRLVLQAKAIERRLAAERDHAMCDNHTNTVSLAALSAMHLEETRAIPHKHRLAFERRLQKLAQELPVWPWVASVRGFGPLGLAQIIGECGDLWNYPSPAKVWKRMGLAVIDGERQRRVAGADAIEHGYVPRRRSLMYNIGESLIKGNGDGEYRAYYLAEKERQREKLPDAPQILIHNRARRHMEKRLLKHLWQAWRAYTPQEA